MKNIHLIPTDKPSRLIIQNGNKLILGNEEYSIIENRQHIYITSSNDIEVGDWYYLPRTNSVYKCNEDATELNLERRLGVGKIILTSDHKLINDGVQDINDEFLNWYVNNLGCEKVEIEDSCLEVRPCDCVMNENCLKPGYKIIIPKAEIKQENCCTPIGQIKRYIDCKGCGKKPKQETLEEESEREASLFYEKGSLDWNKYRQVFIEGAKWQQNRSYGEEEVLELLLKMNEWPTTFDSEEEVKEWFEQFKK